MIRIDGLRFFKDNGNNESGSGMVARIRIYDGALTAAELLDMDPSAGPQASASSTAKPRPIGKRKGKPPRSVATGLVLACPAAGAPCPFSAEVLATKKGKERSIGSLSGEVAAGNTSAPITVKLSKSGRKLIARKGKLAITANATVTAGGGTPASATANGRF